MHKLACAAAVAAMASAGAVAAAGTDYSGQWCGHVKSEMLVAGPELTVFSAETWAIETPGASTPKDMENSAVHCVGYVRIMHGKQWSTTACQFTDPGGDTFTGEAVNEPDKPGTWTFLHGTGEWKGIQGGGHYETVSRSKPVQGSSAMCLKHSGSFTLPTQ